MSANVDQKMKFKNKYSKPEGYTKNKLEHQHLQDKVILIRESEVIKAKNIDEARSKFKNNIDRKFRSSSSGVSEFNNLSEFNKLAKSSDNKSEDYYETEISSIEFLDEVEEGKLSSQQPSTMFLKAASPIEYNFTTHEKKFINNNGFCVEDNLLGIYSPLIKKFTFKAIVEISSEFYKLKNIEWDREMGYSTECIMHLCQHFKISAYAFDIMGNAFLKHITPNNNYPALFFYAMNNHMYLIKDIDQCKSLCERAKEGALSFKTSLVEEIEKKNLFEELPIYENIDVSTIKGYDSAIFIYSRKELSNINDIFEQCLGIFGCPSSKSIQASKSNITKFEYNINKIKYIFVQDPNNIDSINWKNIQELCKKHDVKFKNQTFLSLIKEIRTNLINKKSERKEFTAQEKKVFMIIFQKVNVQFVMKNYKENMNLIILNHYQVVEQMI